MRTKLYASVAFAALVTPVAAYAQSTGTIDLENKGTEIVVTGASITRGVDGVAVPDSSKAKAVLTQDFISRQAPGQSINETINALPGVSFQNNDPYGSSGGSLSIRGFDNSRISETFDGVPLNDSGNYALYSNQQLDPEVIEQVNVNLGTTDVDSPTASATGSTVNYRTRLPGKDFGVKLVGSVGDFDYMRIFGMVDTGEFTPFGTRAFASASTARNRAPFNSAARIEKKQFNARIYQPIGSHGDFISVAGHYNENRNNFLGSVPLRTDTAAVTGSRVVGPNSTNRFPLTRDEAVYVVPLCQINTLSGPGAQVANSCGSIFDERFNPSNTGNIRVASRFTLADGLVLTVDPSYQYVKANGGGTVVAQEGLRDLNPAGGTASASACVTTPHSASNDCFPGYWSGVPYFGRDLNGDADLLDTVRVLAPSQTGTNRIGVISSLRYDFTKDQTVRIAYTYDRARHHQTGETGFLLLDGKPADVFPINNGLIDTNGRVLQKRDRLSFAILQQVSGEYRGKFLDGRLDVNLGVRAPFFRRNLRNNCATSTAAGFVECATNDVAAINAYLADNPTQTVVQSAAAAAGATCTTAATPVCTFPTQGPQQRILNYSRVLPNAGFTFEVMPKTDVFFSYSKGLQVPGTDNLYNSFYFPATSEKAQPKPESSDNFDLGVRYRSSIIQAQLVGWMTKYTNRLASSYDPDLDKTTYRNLGKVDRWGIDGNIAVRPVSFLTLYGFGSYLHSEIKDNVEAGRTTAAGPLGPIGSTIFAPTAGKRESNAPIYTWGGGADLDLKHVSIGADIKRTGPRYLYDTNEAVFQIVSGTTYQVYGAKAPGYTLVNLNARVYLDWAGLGKKTYFQVNALNVFNKLWVGSINSGNGSLNQGPTYSADGTKITAYGNALNSQIGYPRTLMGSLIVSF